MIIYIFCHHLARWTYFPFKLLIWNPKAGSPPNIAPPKVVFFGWFMSIRSLEGGCIFGSLFGYLWTWVAWGPRCRSPPCFWSHRFWVRKPGAKYLTVYFFREDGTLSYPAGLLGGILLGRCGWPACLAVALRAGQLA